MVLKKNIFIRTLIIVIFCLIIGLIVYILIINNRSKEYLLNIDIDNIDSDTSPIYYTDIINRVKNEYNNDDVKGILEIDNTDYITPVVQGSDNDYYLHHDAYRNSNNMGAVYLDYRVDIDSSRKILIFGHNSSRIDMPFKILEEFYDKDYFDNHRYIFLTTSNVKKKYEIFSVYVETKDFSYMNLNFDSDMEYYNHILSLKNKSMYDTGVNVSKDDEILILQTCSTNKDYSDYQDKYLLIILRRV